MIVSTIKPSAALTAVAPAMAALITKIIHTEGYEPSEFAREAIELLKAAKLWPPTESKEERE